jgi:hypothetical protein
MAMSRGGSGRGTPGNTTLGRYGYGPRVQPAVAFRRRDAGAWIAPRRSGRRPRRVEGFYSQEDASLREIVAAFEQETGKQVEVSFHVESELPAKRSTMNKAPSAEPS